MFAFYQPNIFDTGRSWLLLLLKKSKIAYRAALGVSCYFLTMALSDAEEGAEHAVRKQLRWGEVEKKTGNCFDSLRTDVKALNLSPGGIPVAMLETVELMNSITQVMNFELVMGKSTRWKTHHPAAIILFEDIMAHREARSFDQDQPQSKFVLVLLGIGNPVRTDSVPTYHVWSPIQAGFRLCAGLLIFIDIMSSAAIGETLRLVRYHDDVLAQVDDRMPGVGDAEIGLSNIVGCRNWAARSIAEISTIKSWKRARIEYCSTLNGSIEVRHHCHRVDNELNDNIFILKSSLTASAKSYPNHHDALNKTQIDLGSSPSISSVMALIWGLAAQLYFFAVLHGHQNHPSVQASVAHILDLPKNVACNQLRTVAWSICVARCLALESHEPLCSRLGKNHTAGALADAKQIMEEVWQQRSIFEDGHWELASCFGIFGSPMLLT